MFLKFYNVYEKKKKKNVKCIIIRADSRFAGPYLGVEGKGAQLYLMPRKGYFF